MASESLSYPCVPASSEFRGSGALDMTSPAQTKAR